MSHIKSSLSTSKCGNKNLPMIAQQELNALRKLFLLRFIVLRFNRIRWDCT
jgi:hypothetical protein